jgi:Protein of unknown function (DUF1524)
MTQRVLGRTRRLITVIVSLIGLAVVILAAAPPVIKDVQKTEVPPIMMMPPGSAGAALETLAVKGRAPKTDYARSQFGNGWATTSGCDTRNIILYRDLQNPIVGDDCAIQTGTLNDSYTGTVISFIRSESDIQIDHVVALSNAWQTGAQNLTRDQRIQLANDPLELIAVQGDANQQKSDADAATWLPSNKPFRCQYVARQIAVKQKYSLWVTEPEKQAMLKVLSVCPDQALPSR